MGWMWLNCQKLCAADRGGPAAQAWGSCSWQQWLCNPAAQPGGQCLWVTEPLTSRATWDRGFQHLLAQGRCQEGGCRERCYKHSHPWAWRTLEENTQRLQGLGEETTIIKSEIHLLEMTSHLDSRKPGPSHSRKRNPNRRTGPCNYTRWSQERNPAAPVHSPPHHLQRGGWRTGLKVKHQLAFMPSELCQLHVTAGRPRGSPERWHNPSCWWPACPRSHWCLHPRGPSGSSPHRWHHPRWPGWWLSPASSPRPLSPTSAGETPWRRRETSQDSTRPSRGNSCNLHFTALKGQLLDNFQIQYRRF